MTDKNYIDLLPVSRVEGVVRLPGSKSISNRTLLLAALAEGTTEIQDLLASDDTAVMLDALEKLGIRWNRRGSSQEYEVEGTRGVLPNRQASLFMGNAGTAIRPLTAALAVLGGDFTLHGVPRMHERPIGDLVEALNAAGAKIAYTGEPGYPPLHILSGHIQAHELHVRGDVSSQFLTALLMAAPLMAGGHDVVIHVTGELISRPYIEITLNMMRRFGIEIEQDGWRSFRIRQGQVYRSPGTIRVEGDASSASYFLAAGAIAKGPVRVEGVGKNSIQGDVRFAQVLEKMGATVTYGENWIEARSNGVLKAIDDDFNLIPDAAMTVAVLALYADGVSTLRNIGSWRVKETDRIAAMARELRKVGSEIEDGGDYLRIKPIEIRESIVNKITEIDTYGDHRMAMSLSLASLDGSKRKGHILRIKEPGVVNKTYPEYFVELKRITGR